MTTTDELVEADQRLASLIASHILLRIRYHRMGSLHAHLATSGFREAADSAFQSLGRILTDATEVWELIARGQDT